MLTVLDFLKTIKGNVSFIKIFTGDNHIILVSRDEANDFKQILVRTVLNNSVEEYEINYSSKTETLRLFTTLSLQQIDLAFELHTKVESDIHEDGF